MAKPPSALNAIPAVNVNKYHDNDDVDSDTTAHHHTLGGSAMQAAPGNHDHDDEYWTKTDSDARYVEEFGITVNYAPNCRNTDGSAIAHTLNHAKYRIEGGVCHWMISVTVHVSTGQFLMFTLPIPTTGVAPSYLGGGREDAVTGNQLIVFKANLVDGQVFTYNNGATVVNNWRLQMAGSYIINSS